MLKEFLNHQLERALDGKITNALRNCHATGLYSIMFHDEPGNRVRMFYAETNHVLWLNNPVAGDCYSLAIHPHHCDLQFIGLFGDARNDRYRLLEGDEWMEMEYQSAIHTGEGKLTPTGRTYIPFHVVSEPLMTNPKMRASELHSIYVPRGHASAWMVIEGKSDPDYVPYCYTNHDNHDFTGLYRPMKQREIVSILGATINNVG